MQFSSLCHQFIHRRLWCKRISEALNALLSFADWWFTRSVAIRSKSNHEWPGHQWPGVSLHQNRSVIKTLSRQSRVRTLFQKQISRIFQHSDWVSQYFKILINPLTPKISMLIHLTVCHTFHFITRVFITREFHNFQGTTAFFQDFPVLKHATIKFKDFPSFPGPCQ